jgi:hypothetical protein
MISAVPASATSIVPSASASASSSSAAQSTTGLLVGVAQLPLLHPRLLREVELAVVVYRRWWPLHFLLHRLESPHHIRQCEGGDVEQGLDRQHDLPVPPWYTLQELHH